MKRVPLYSSSRSQRPGRAIATIPSVGPEASKRSGQNSVGEISTPARGWWRKLQTGDHAVLKFATIGVLALLLFFAYAAFKPVPVEITQEQIRAAVLHTLETETLPS